MSHRPQDGKDFSALKQRNLLANCLFRFKPWIAVHIILRDKKKKTKQ